jgi:hypothetical protein
MPDDAVDAQQPLDAFVIDPATIAGQLGGDSRRSVGAVRAGVDRADLGQQSLFVLLTLRRPARGLVASGVVGRPRHPAAAQAAATGYPAAFWSSTQR